MDQGDSQLGYPKIGKLYQAPQKPGKKSIKWAAAAAATTKAGALIYSNSKQWGSTSGFRLDGPMTKV